MTVISFAFLGCLITDKMARADTNVGGIIGSNTTWSIDNSPYTITDTVQIPKGITLRIDPGVVVRKNNGTMFMLEGTIYAHGTSDNKITFDGIDDYTVIFTIAGDRSAYADLDNVIAKNGSSFWYNEGHIGRIFLQHSELKNFDNPADFLLDGETNISYNKIINSRGFRFYSAGNAVRAIVQNNLFYNDSEFKGGLIEVLIRDYSELVIKYNSFIGMGKNYLYLADVSGTSSFSATENYWGAPDESVAEYLIFDRNDGIQCPGTVDYLPVLTSSHPDTPELGVLVPETCVSWQYSSWSSCSENGQQKRTITSATPYKCSGGSPVLTRSCQYTAPTCTSWTYSDWSACSKGTQTRTVLSSMPAGCAGGDSVLSRSCSIAPTAPNPDPIITTATDGALNADIKDGDIIQCTYSANPFAVYIVKEAGGKKYIRHIVNLNIFNHYKHLQWGNLKQIDSLTGFSLSGWVRVNTGPNGTAGANDKVYEINGDQTKHWINMTAQQFLTHGGSEEAIYSINQGELDLYTTGASVSSL